MNYFQMEATKEDLSKMSNLSLAYLGDCVFELMVRSFLCLEKKTTSNKLHKAALQFVSAPAQANLAKDIIPLLSEEEGAVFKRGRNAKVNSIPKMAKREEYQLATALETLFGWLYLQGNTSRINELFTIMLSMED